MENPALTAIHLTIIILTPLIVLAILPASIAASKGRSFTKWFVYGFFLWLIALIHSIVLASRRCPFCAERIRVEAKICPHCQRDLVCASTAEPHRQLMLEGL